MKSIEPYKEIIGDIPPFLNKYLNLPMLTRLKKISYFCGMDYASKEIYNFLFKITRYDHSLTTALITWRFSKKKDATIAALFHDIATPCFSHVIDYMNKDYETQESTEEKTEEIIRKNKELPSLLKEDNLTLEDMDFKKYSLVDNKRPSLCADRLDGIILTSLSWTKKLKLEEIEEILENTEAVKNEENNVELGFKKEEIAKKVMLLNEEIDKECHSKQDTFMMLLLADITKYLIKKKEITYDDLYQLNEEELFFILNNYAKKDKKLKELLNQFYHMKDSDIPCMKIPKLKNRYINPLVNKKRLLK